MAETGLKGIKTIPSAKVMVSDSDYFSVRGLGLHHITTIYRNHQGEIGAWFENIVEQGDGGPKLSFDQLSTIMDTVLTSAPLLAYEIIAHASGNGDAETLALAQALPMAAQVDALQKTAELTFTSEMPPKKVFEIVINLIRADNAKIGDPEA